MSLYKHRTFSKEFLHNFSHIAHVQSIMFNQANKKKKKLINRTKLTIRLNYFISKIYFYTVFKILRHMYFCSVALTF